MILCSDDETIIAQCTPQGSGAIALLRISGINAIEVATRISKLPANKQLSNLPTHTIHYGWVIDEKETAIDQVIFLLMHAPKTFTGQDTVEITCHNNQFIVESIIQQALMHGARLAQEGEFTKRAVINNKIDLIQAEAINELIHANTQLSLKQSLAQLEGSLSGWIVQIEQDLLKALAFSEASFEFIDEEMEFGKQIQHIINNILSTITTIKKTFNQQQQIRQGIRIAIIGAVNAGKSSLFNALINQKRAIVTSIAGTTRDAIEAGLYKNGNYWTLIDTAGLRKAEDIIEQEGIQRSFAQAQQADIILLVFDGARITEPQEQEIYQQLIKQYRNKVMLVRNKGDLNLCSNQSFSTEPVITVSTKTKKNIDLLEKNIEEKIRQLFQEIEAPFLLNKRQYNLILGLEKKLNEIQAMFNTTIQYELLSYHLNDALAQIAELSGKSISEQGMDKIFKEFCIGK